MTTTGKTAPNNLAATRRGSPKRLRWTPGLTVGVALLVSIVVVSFGVPMFTGTAASELTGDVNLGPSPKHWLGTDVFGRDMMVRALAASQLSLLMTLGATVIAVVLGIALGTAITVAPRRLREFALRVVEIAVSYPELLVAVVIAAILGSGSMQMIAAIGVATMPGVARLTTTLAASVYEKDFVTTARLLGVPNRQLITRHLLPNMAEPLLIQVASVFSVGLVAISALSFVGLGVQTPEYDLGRLLADGLPAIYTRPLEVVGPTLMIVLISLAAMLIGDGLAAAADPRVSNRPRKVKGASPRRESIPGNDDCLVSVRDLRVTRPDGRVLVHGISFTVQEGEILGVVGESGSGKSLTAMSIAQLLPDGLRSDATEMRVGAMDLLSTVPNQELATTIGLIYQDPGTTFNPVLRMGSQLTDVLRVHRKLRLQAARAAILDKLATVRIVDPAKLLRSRPYELSGGMRQRAMIASALATSPVLIIADEPTTALDVTVQADILREFKRINRTRSTSMLFISHDIGVVEALCDRVIIMKDGKIVEELSVVQLKAGEVSHPYTKMLLNSVPRIEDSKKVRK